MRRTPVPTFTCLLLCLPCFAALLFEACIDLAAAPQDNVDFVAGYDTINNNVCVADCSSLGGKRVVHACPKNSQTPRAKCLCDVIDKTRGQSFCDTKEASHPHMASSWAASAYALPPDAVKRYQYNDPSKSVAHCAAGEIASCQTIAPDRIDCGCVN
jgi:hypothetical protein